jgi:8-oxo-dGTP diphosphatase
MPFGRHTNKDIIQAIMDIPQLTQMMDAFVTSKGWYETNSPRPQTSRNLAISLSLEAAELLEHFQWCDEAGDKSELESELADVMLYLLQLAHRSGIDLEQAVLHKLEINTGRTWDAGRCGDQS